MDPLVDEYAASDKGVNLKNLAVAEEKVRRFIKKMQYICLGLASVEAVHHIIRYKLAAWSSVHGFTFCHSLLLSLLRIISKHCL